MGNTGSGMSGSDRFDIVTGILSMLVLFCALLERALPSTRLQLLEKRLKHTEADLDGLCEEGMFSEECIAFIERLARSAASFVPPLATLTTGVQTTRAMPRPRCACPRR